MPSYPQPPGLFPTQTGPFFGGPTGFQPVVLPCLSVTSGAVIALTSARYIDWFGRYADQITFGTVADADVAGDPLVNVDGLGQKPVYSGGFLATAAISEGDYYQLVYDQALGAAGGFHLLNWSTIGAFAGLVPVANGGTGTDGAIRLITTADPVVVSETDAVIVLNKAAPSATAIGLPPVAGRRGIALKVVDFAGNGGDITLTANGAETIMGLPSAVLGSAGAGVGTAAALTLYPSIDLNGWYVA